MANNKVELSTGEVLIDLTSDTVTASNLLAGETAHDRSGNSVTGTVNLNNYVLKSGDTMTGTLNLSNANISITGGNLKVNDTSNNTNRVEKANFINAWYSSTGNKTYWGKMTEAGISFGQTTGDIRSSEVTAFTSPKSQLTSTSLKVNTHDLLKLSPHLAQMFATEIPANANLNTESYTEVKTYYCESNATAQSLSSCPVTDAFTMTVESPNQTNYSNDNDHVRYRVRIIKTYVGRQYVQYCYAASGGNSWTYSAWKKIVDGFEDNDNSVGWFKTMGTRPTSLDIPHYYDDRARMRLDLSTSSQTGGVNAVFGEGYVFTFMWDSSARWDSQLYIPDADGKAPAYRTYKPSANAWSDVYRFVTSGQGNYINNSNLNNYTESGFYIVGSGNTNAPESWAAMIVCSAGNTAYGVHQMMFNANGMWIRSYTGSPLAWTTWIRRF